VTDEHTFLASGPGWSGHGVSPGPPAGGSSKRSRSGGALRPRDQRSPPGSALPRR
jgi:hypothetical protein